MGKASHASLPTMKTPKKKFTKWAKAQYPYPCTVKLFFEKFGWVPTLQFILFRKQEIEGEKMQIKILVGYYLKVEPKLMSSRR